MYDLRDVGTDTLKDLKNLRDRTNDVTTSLKNLGCDVDNWNDLLVFHLVRKLDKVTRREWETKLGDTADYPQFTDLTSFLNTRIRTLEALGTCPDSGKTSSPSGKNKYPQNKFVRSHVATSVNQCITCTANHPPYLCDIFKSKSVNDRVALAREHKRCFNCLKAGHFPVECPSKNVCNKCKRKHHTLLHFEPGSSSETPTNSSASTNAIVQQPPEQTQTVSNTSICYMNRDAKQKTVLLATAWVLVRTSSGREQKLRALLDQGSEATLITESVVQQLRAPRQRITSTVFGIGDIQTATATSVATFTIEACHGDGPVIPACALILNKLTSYKPAKISGKNNWQHLMNIPLADPEPDSATPIDLLIGADLYSSIFINGFIKGSKDEPIAQNTIFGWVLSGPVSNQGANTSRVNINRCSLVSDLDTTLTRLWENEELPPKQFLTDEDKQCDAHFAKNHSRADDRKYIVSLPFKTNPPLDIGDSYFIALTAYIRLEKRLARNPEHARLYHEFLNEYLRLGHMCLVDDNDVNLDSKQRVYLTHHPVLREDSTTTRLRVVFNASMPTSNGSSLNDHLLVGPKLQADIRDILIKWRDPLYVFSADITKMFRQIWVAPNDTYYQLILFRPRPDGPSQTYRLLTVTYGEASSPYLANRVIKQLVEDEGASYPLAVSILRDQIYVDDTLFGADDLTLAKEKRYQTTELAKAGGFVLSKWASNCPELLNDIDVKHHAISADKMFQEDEGLKLLGMYWNPCNDAFKFRMSPLESFTLTKRSVLSVIAKIYDPFGWISPVVIAAKIFMQRLWIAQVGWDDPLPTDLAQEWEIYSSELPQIQEVSIPRWTGRSDQSLHLEIHGFSDASSQAYASVVYLKVIDNDHHVRISLIMSKTKVAPIKPMSIPRLELAAAVLLTHTVEYVQNAMNLSHVPVYCWTDSTVVLAWLKKHPSQWKMFIANRVADIQTRVPMAIWRHVPTASNPADCASRGINPNTLLTHPLWWNGPSWLSQPENHWPKPDKEIPETHLEEKGIISVHTIAPEPEWELSTKFSSWRKLLRVTAYVLRFVRILRESTSAESRSVTVSEILAARQFWIKYLQERYFKGELSSLKSSQSISKRSTILRLDPVLDKIGTIRVGGRLRNSLLPYAEQSPIILPPHGIVDLIIADCHANTLNGGTQLMLRVLRQTFWIMNARNLVKNCVRKCVTCVRERACTSIQKMGDLPTVRVTPSRPFAHSGVDYAGPLQVRYQPGRGRQSHKAYIALFICLSTRAIHLELVSDYSTETFLAAFDRFASRRGLPSVMYSDNGTNFRGADKELSLEFERVSQDAELRNRLASDGTDWQFLPPNAPRFGGIWEAGVKSVKTHLKKIIGQHTPTFEEINTLLCKIEGCLNSRPIAPFHDDVDNFDALTPGHFLVGGVIKIAPRPSLLDLKENRLSRWQLVNQMLEKFWHIWSTDYLQSLQKRLKWTTSQDNIRIGDLVLIKNSQLPPANWELGRIVECHPGQDGHIRVVSVKTARSRYTRPITQICLLPIHAPDNEHL